MTVTHPSVCWFAKFCSCSPSASRPRKYAMPVITELESPMCSKWSVLYTDGTPGHIVHIAADHTNAVVTEISGGLISPLVLG